jgi:hypothetical protein
MAALPLERTSESGGGILAEATLLKEIGTALIKGKS